MDAYDELWVLGDDFTAATFQQYVKDAVRPKKLFMTENFEVLKFVEKSYCTHIRNFLARLKLQFARAINERLKFPKVCLVVLDDDPIRHTKLNEENASTMLNKAIPWLIKEFHKLIEIRKDQLQSYAVKANYPLVYWMESPQHINFKNNWLRRKLNSVIQNEANRYLNIRITCMKKVWDAEDRSLFQNNRFTATGLFKYWASIDNALEFNLLNAVKKEAQEILKAVEDKKKLLTSDRFHWSFNLRQRMGRDRANADHRFKLPQAKYLDFS